MNIRRWACLSPMLLAATGCQLESQARQELEKDGYTNIELKKDGDGFSFTADKDGDKCEGTISVRASFGSKSSTKFVTCAGEHPPIVDTTCRKDAPAFCYEQGVEAEKKNDFATARQRFESGCLFDHADSCNSFALALGKGEGGPADTDKAFTTFEKACTLGAAVGCHNAGITAEFKLQPPRLEDARKLYATGCAGKHADSCNNLAVMQSNGAGGTKDDVSSFDLYKKACELGSDLGCANMGERKVTGRGTPLDVEGGKKLLEQACDAGRRNPCFTLALLLAEGKAGPPDHEKAYELFKKACDLELGNACNSQGFALERGQGVAKDVVAAATLYEKACELGHGMGCANFGISLEDGMGQKKDAARAQTYFEKACKLGYEKACKMVKPAR